MSGSTGSESAPPPSAAQPGKARPTAKFVVAVWGEEYIRRFERYALASILAPNNLPKLVESVDVEFVILTSSDDIEYFRSRELMARTEKYVRVRYIAIDDILLPGSYSVTLTLAFTRGVASFGSEQTRHHFIFWNADFVMSDGTLAALGKHIVAGRRIILAGSYRAAAEDLQPILDRMIEAGRGTLSASSRELVDLALRYPHMTSIARTVNQSCVRTYAPTQLFWSDFDQTVVAHFFQIFMFSLKPTRVIRKINCYCDYSFIPELCPGQPLHVVDDSDEMFLLELQQRESERELVGYDTNTVGNALPSYAEWSTVEQREAGKVPVVLHAGPLDERVAELKQQSGAFVAELEAKAPEPTSYIGHRNWMWGVTAWLERRAEEKFPEYPRELDLSVDLEALASTSHKLDFETRAYRVAPREALASRVADRLLGRAPRFSRLHAQAPSFRLLLEEIARLKKRLADDLDFRLIVAAPVGAWIDGEFPFGDPRIYRIEPRQLRYWSVVSVKRVQAALIVVEYPYDPPFADLLANVRSAVAADGEIILALRKPVDVSDPAWLGRARLGAASAAQALGLGCVPELVSEPGGDQNLAHFTNLMVQAVRDRHWPSVFRWGRRVLRSAWRVHVQRRTVVGTSPDSPVQLIRLRLAQPVAAPAPAVTPEAERRQAVNA